MKAKHLTKNTMSHKHVFLTVGIVIAIIAAFSICATNQANAEGNDQVDNEITSIIVTQPGDETEKKGSVDPKWHDPQDKVKQTPFKWTKDYNVISTHCVGHNVYQATVVASSRGVLSLTLEDSKKLICGIGFSSAKSEDGNWYVGSQIVTGTPMLLSGNATIEYKAPTVNVDISGQVEDADGLPVSGATVEFSSKAPVNAFNLGERSTTTGADGKFTLSDIPEDEFPGYIIITKDGFEPYTSDEITKEKAESGVIDLSDIKLTPKEEPIPPSPDPTPEPTPTNNTTVNGGTPQTGDDANVAFAVFGLLMLAGSGVLIARKLYVK